MLENPRQIGKAQGGALRDATVESTPLLSITAIALDFIAVLHTGTTVASLIATNTRVLPHARRSCGTVASRTTHTRHLSYVPDLGVLNPWCYNS